MDKLLEDAMNKTKTLNNLFYVEALKWDINTIRQVYEYASSKNINGEEWLPAVNMWLRLNFAIQSLEVKLPITSEQFDELKQLANILDMTDNKWENNIEIIKRPENETIRSMKRFRKI